MKHSIEVLKLSQNRLNETKLSQQVQKMVDRGMASNRKAHGWKISKGPITHSAGHDGIIYRCVLHVESTKEQYEEELPFIQDIIQKAGNANKWHIAKVDNRDLTGADKLEMEYAPVIIPPNWKTFFTHIYGLDAQIEIILSRIEAAQDSNWTNRFHCALVGPPACGKTEVARAFKRMLGSQAVLEYDATSTTMAGAIKDLDSREILPRILLIEEIEKADENSFRWLLSVMDPRAEIRKVTFRQSIQRETKMLGIVTVNDYKFFKTIMSGALASRCGRGISFPKPTRAILQKILQREILKVRGNLAWIGPALDYAESVKMTDPRHIIAVCLAGKHRLITGEYQKKLKQCELCD